MRKVWILGLVAAVLAPLSGSTLEQLSLDDMIRLSTAIVHGKAQQTYSEFRNSLIYTHYQVQVSETFKGAPVSQLDMVVPGGALNRLQETFAGAPTLAAGQDYILFLWTSKSGLTQVIGLSQGLFVVMNTGGQSVVMRPAAAERMLNAAGQPVVDTDIRMLLSDLKLRIRATLSSGGTK